MLVETVVTGPLQENCYLVACPETREALVIDPGDDAPVILSRLRKARFNARIIAVTHEHFDHIGAVTQVREATGALLAMNPQAYQRLPEMSQLAESWLGKQIPAIAEPDLSLEEGQELNVGQLVFQVAYCPGHAPGHVVLIGEGAVFGGDVLFRQSIGRYDLPGGDGQLLLENIREKLLTLPEETLVFPGHGPPTTIGAERRENPFLRGL
ncbi:MAG TPA: MBL fold metallo-hydrolase [Dehalococcoidia bacterium]|nr:MBL fold metallo-hydrolase [Dehalococcoidia bacterium]